MQLDSNSIYAPVSGGIAIALPLLLLMSESLELRRVLPFLM